MRIPILAGSNLLLFLCAAPVMAQIVSPDTLQVRSRWTIIRDIEPLTYAVRKATGPLRIDGNPDEAAWQAIEWSERFGDIEGDRQDAPPLRTRMKMLWDDDYLYVAADMEEPHLWASITDSTRAIWHDKDFEVFVDPDGDNHHYFELEVNAFNRTNEVHFPRAYGDAGRSDRRAWMDGLKTANHFVGTLNDRRDTDKAWMMEIALPWSGFARYGTGGGPPEPGEVWRINLARVNWDLLPDSTSERGYVRNGPRRGHNWSWTPQGIVLMHIPEMWGYVQFRADDSPPDSPSPFHVRARDCLHDAYYRNIEFRRPAGRQARSLEELYGPDGPQAPCHDMIFEARAEGFLIRMVDVEAGRSASIDHRRHFSIPATDAMSRDLR